MMRGIIKTAFLPFKEQDAKNRQEGTIQRNYS